MNIAPARKFGFTLIEVLCVIGLFAIVSGLALSFSPNLYQAFERPSPELYLRSVVNYARSQAQQQHRNLYLRYDAEAQSFVITASQDSENALQVISPKVKFDTLQLKAREPVEFSALSGAQEMRVQSVSLVQFAPDGSNTPFIISARSGNAVFEFEIHPVTGEFKPLSR